MKAKLFFAFAAFALTLGVTPGKVAAAANQCLSYCAVVRCIADLDDPNDYVCGPYVNSSGQTVCGCHPGPVRP